MKIIAGLGNPGDKYANTKHNVGYMFLDELAAHWKVSDWREKHEALAAETYFNDEKIILIKPLTFMNESGRAVGAFLNWYKLEAKDLIVVHDDMDMPVGMHRIRKKGSSGGHNGIKSILSHVGDENFVRFKIGIGHPTDNPDVIHHVLSPFHVEDREKINEAIKILVQAAECVIKYDADMAMNRYNPRKEKKKNE